MTGSIDKTNDAGASRQKKERRRQQRSLRTQQKLLEAALEAFADNGFKGTSTRVIAERAGVHHPLITYHFHSKEELWRAAVNRMFSRFTKMLGEVRKRHAEDSPRDRVVALIRTVVRYAAGNPEMHKIILHESGHDNPRLDWLTDTWLRTVYVGWVPDLNSLQRDGIAPQGDVALLYNMLRMCSSSMMALRIEIKGTSGMDLHDARNVDALADMIVQMFLSGQPVVRDDAVTA